VVEKEVCPVVEALEVASARGVGKFFSDSGPAFQLNVGRKR
jgi:hypothetical protein